WGDAPGAGGGVGVGADAAEVGAGLALREIRRRDPRALEELPRALERQPLRRVHRLCFSRRDAEERRVEAIDVADEAADGAVRLAGRVRIGRIELLGVPAPGRKRLGRVAPLTEQAPAAPRARHPPP